VIAHELGHLKCDHGVWLTVANLLTLGLEISPLTPSFVAGGEVITLLLNSTQAPVVCSRHHSQVIPLSGAQASVSL